MLTGYCFVLLSHSMGRGSVGRGVSGSMMGGVRWRGLGHGLPQMIGVPSQNLLKILSHIYMNMNISFLVNNKNIVYEYVDGYTIRHRKVD